MIMIILDIFLVVVLFAFGKTILWLKRKLDLAVIDRDAAQRMADLKTRQPDTELVKFAREVIKKKCWGFSLDGLEIQDLAEELCLIVTHTATEDDVDEESDFEIGDRIYKFSELLKE